MPKVHSVSRKFLKRHGVKNPPRTVEQIKTHLQRDPDYFRFPSDVSPTIGVSAVRSSPDWDNDSSSGKDELPKETTVANGGGNGTNASIGLNPAEIAVFDADSEKGEAPIEATTKPSPSTVNPFGTQRRISISVRRDEASKPESPSAENSYDKLGGDKGTSDKTTRKVASTMSLPMIINENDVLLGRGGRNHEHQGNKQLRRIARGRVREYARASKKQKAVITREVLQQIQEMEPPGRFLQPNNSTHGWDVVSQERARDKVCQSLRDATSVQRESWMISTASPTLPLATAPPRKKDIRISDSNSIGVYSVEPAPFDTDFEKDAPGDAPIEATAKTSTLNPSGNKRHIAVDICRDEASKPESHAAENQCSKLDDNNSISDETPQKAAPQKTETIWPTPSRPSARTEKERASQDKNSLAVEVFPDETAESALHSDSDEMLGATGPAPLVLSPHGSFHPMLMSPIAMKRTQSNASGADALLSESEEEVTVQNVSEGAPVKAKASAASMQGGLASSSDQNRHPRWCGCCYVMPYPPPYYPLPPPPAVGYFLPPPPFGYFYPPPPPPDYSMTDSSQSQMPHVKNAIEPQERPRTPQEEPQESPKNQSAPTSITTLHPHDVVGGSGSRWLYHHGNARFRQIVESHVQEYRDPSVESKHTAEKIVASIRGLDPPGRFLKEIPRTGRLAEIGDKEARKKTRQALGAASRRRNDAS